MSSNAAVRYAERDLDTLDYATGLCRHKAVAVQAGGNLGVFPRYLAREFAAVYTFEPDPHNFDVMCARLAGERNVVKIQAALGVDRGMVATAPGRRDGSPRPTHEGLVHVCGPGIIPTLRVDDMALFGCDLLVLDLEGYELHALQGARETVKRYKPVIMCETGKHSEHYGHTQEDIRTWIRMAGYDHVTRMRSDDIFVPREEKSK